MLRRSALLSLSCLAVASAFIPAVPAPQQAGLVSEKAGLFGAAEGGREGSIHLMRGYCLVDRLNGCCTPTPA